MEEQGEIIPENEHMFSSAAPEGDSVEQLHSNSQPAPSDLEANNEHLNGVSKEMTRVIGSIPVAKEVQLEIGVDPDGVAILDWPLATKMLMPSARMLTGSRQAAEDLVQDTLLRAFNALKRYEPGTNAAGWLFRIMSNANINRFRHEARRPVTSLDEVGGEAAYGTGNTMAVSWTRTQSQGAEEVYFAGKYSEGVVLELVGRLPEHFQQTVMLADVHGLSYKEVAEALGIPIGTVMSRLHRGRKLLIGFLEESEEVA